MTTLHCHKQTAVNLCGMCRHGGVASKTGSEKTRFLGLTLYSHNEIGRCTLRLGKFTNFNKVYYSLSFVVGVPEFFSRSCSIKLIFRKCSLFAGFYKFRLYEESISETSLFFISYVVFMTCNDLSSYLIGIFSIWTMYGILSCSIMFIGLLNTLKRTLL